MTRRNTPTHTTSRTSAASQTSATSTPSPTSNASGLTRRMTDSEAAWVREHAWTEAMRKTYSSTPAVLAMCPCEHGPCGNCSAGHHADCPYDKPSNAQWATGRANVHVGWITTADEQVPTLGGTDSWQLWEAGIQHDARCPCALADHHGALNQPTDPVTGQQTTIYDFLKEGTSPCTA